MKKPRCRSSAHAQLYSSAHETAWVGGSCARPRPPGTCLAMVWPAAGYRSVLIPQPPSPFLARHPHQPCRHVSAWRTSPKCFPSPGCHPVGCPSLQARNRCSVTILGGDGGDPDHCEFRHLLPGMQPDCRKLREVTRRPMTQGWLPGWRGLVCALVTSQGCPGAVRAESSAGEWIRPPGPSYTVLMVSRTLLSFLFFIRTRRVC